MKKFFRSIFAALILVSSFASTLAQTSVDPMKLPKLSQWVTDFSSTLSLGQTEELNTLARDYETQTSNQLVTVLFPDRQGNELIDIGMKIFTDNAIGQAKKNNGLLLLISTQEKKIRIVVGYWLEGIYPDAVAKRIIEENIRPLVNTGDFAGAVKIFYSRSAEIIGWEFSIDKRASSAQSYFNEDGFYMFFMWFMLWLTWGQRINYLKKKKRLSLFGIKWLGVTSLLLSLFLLFVLRSLVSLLFFSTFWVAVIAGFLTGWHRWKWPWGNTFFFGGWSGWWGGWFGWGWFGWWWGFSGGGGAGD